MYSVGVFFAWDFLAVIFVTIAYLLCPKMIIEKKIEYVKFFLIFFSLFFTLFIVVTNIVGDKDLSHHLFKLSLAPALLIANLIYPFKTVRRNQHLNFFLFFISLYSIGLLALIAVAHAFSNM